MAQIVSISISSGYFIKRLPFEILRQITQCEDVLFWHIVKPNGKIELSSIPTLLGKKLSLYRYTDKLTIIDYIYNDQKIKIIITPIQIIENGKFWTFWLGISLKTIKVLGRKFIIVNIFLMLFTLILIFLFFTFILNNIRTPINMILKGINEVAKGNLNYKLKIKRNDELGRIGLFFNQMTHRLKRLWKEMEQKNKEIQIVNKELQIANKKLVAKEKELEKYSSRLESLVEEKVKALKETTAQLIQTEKIVALGELVSGIAHEINNPLTAILGYAQVLLLEIEKDNPIRNDIEIIEKEAQRTKNIIENLLKYARDGSFTIEDVDINKVIEDTLSFIEYQLITSRIQIIKKFADNIPKIKGNKQQFQQVFVNMMINAKDAMSNGGILTIRTKVEGNFIVIEFSDTGCGIDKNILNKIFDPFFTTKPAGKGTGLGLSLCARIIHNHNGKIEVESKKNVGTTFKIFLPT